MSLYGEEIVSILDGMIYVISNHVSIRDVKQSLLPQQEKEESFDAENPEILEKTVDKVVIPKANRPDPVEGLARAQSLDALDVSQSRKRKIATANDACSVDEVLLAPTPIPRKKRKLQKSLSSGQGLTHSEQLFIDEMTDRLAALSAPEDDDDEESQSDDASDTKEDANQVEIKVDHAIQELADQHRVSINHPDIRTLRGCLSGLPLRSGGTISEANPDTFAWESHSDSQLSDFSDTFENVQGDDAVRAFGDDGDSEEEKREVMEKKKENVKGDQDVSKDSPDRIDTILWTLTMVTASVAFMCELMSYYWSAEV